jgi:hypothetical protein
LTYNWGKKHGKPSVRVAEEIQFESKIELLLKVRLRIWCSFKSPEGSVISIRTVDCKWSWVIKSEETAVCLCERNRT